jgi:hypothetical protein
MGPYETQNDLAKLPEPRFIYTAPVWLRNFATAILFVGVFFGAGAVAHGLSGSGTLLTAPAGAFAAGLCTWVLVALKPGDWRVWINLAAAPEGLYLVARAGRVVFVPWRDVTEIDVKSIWSRNGIHGYTRLTLRMPDKAWSQFGNTGDIKGRGLIRQYLLSAIAMPGAQLAAELQAFRSSYAR